MLESLDHSILLGFVEEAQSYTPTIRQGIIAFQQDATRGEDIAQAYRQVHTIHGAALMIGLDALGVVAGEVENSLERFQSGASATLDAAEAAVLLSKMSEAERLLDAKVAELQAAMLAGGGADDAAMNAAAFGDFDEAQFAAQFADAPDDDQSSQTENQPQEPKFTADIFEDDEIDPEMLEVFALEAEEHLQIISANLQTLEQNPQHREALQTIRRSSHTLKGAAGVVGFKTTSQLAHRMEDLLDHLAEQPAHSNQQTTALLFASTDVLEGLTRGKSLQDLRTEISNIYRRYDELFAGKQTAQPAEEIVERAHIVEQPQTIETPQAQEIISAPSEHVTAQDVYDFKNAEAQQAENNAAAQTVVPRTVIRVGLERLDEMVKLMGEMVISRTVLEQRLTDIGGQVTEMHLSTNRLQKIAGKLEVDYETSALAGGRMHTAPGFAPAFLAAQQPQFAPASAFEAAGKYNGDKYGFDDLEFDRYTEFHELTRQLVETSTDTSSITGELDDLLNDLDAIINRQRRLSDELQEKLMRLRMVPLGTLATRLFRTVSVTADSEQKRVELDIEGDDVEIDTQVLSALAEPLLHLLRNSVVHGIESAEQRRAAGKPERGSIKLRAFYEGTQIVLSITDDGRGMDARKLREKAVREKFISHAEATAMNDEQALALVFKTGFSTAEKINEHAGRGVGMDIVRDSVQRQQGTISLKSVPGQSTTIQIRLPMSMAVTRALVVRAFGQRFALPLNVILQLAQVAPEDFDQLTQEKILWVGGKFYPVYTLNELLNLPPLAERDEEMRIPVLLIQTGDSAVALALDEIVEAREIVIKPLENPLKKVRELLGATILGDGSVIPILDVLHLVHEQQNKQLQSVAAAMENQIAQNVPVKVAKAQLNIMIVDDSPSVRRVMSNFVTKSGMTAIVAKDGLEAIELLQVSRELPDVILSDVEMPRMDGYELLAAVKRQDNLRDIPVVMITSRAGDKHRQRALELGAADYVVKPYQDSVLLDTIKQLAG